MVDAYHHRHQAQRMAQNADRAEFQAIKDGSTTIGVGIYDERVSGTLDDLRELDPDNETIWQTEDLRHEEAVGSIHEEIERRAGIMKEAYPFALDRGLLTHSQSEMSIYEFFLLACNAEAIKEEDRHIRLSKAFERISVKAIATFFGKNTQHIHIGWPRDSEIGISFKEAMETVANRTGEWRWGPRSDLPDDPLDVKDEGCDFIVWPNPPDDRQIGQLFVLGQCACGNNWDIKLGELNVEKFQKWFNHPFTISPVRAFATPHHVTDAMLAEASLRGGVFFDRARLTLLACRNKEQVFDESAMGIIQDILKLVED